MMFRLPGLRRPRLREYVAGAAALAVLSLALTSATTGHRTSAVDLSAASRPHIANDIKDYQCWKSPSNATCDGVTPDPDSYCYKDAYPVKLDSDGSKYWQYPGTNWWFTTELMYSPHCKSNWAVTDTENPDPSTNGQFSAKIRRFAGHDGPYMMKQAPYQLLTGYQLGDATSPMIYSPHNLAQACGSNDDRTCTGKY
jgi:hypothetical protein